MDVIVIESSAFKAIQDMIAEIKSLVVNQATAIKQLNDNRLMDIHEVMEYTGFGKSWIMERKNAIGFIQIGSSPLRFYKEDLDKFFLKHRIQSKNN